MARMRITIIKHVLTGNVLYVTRLYGLDITREMQNINGASIRLLDSSF